MSSKRPNNGRKAGSMMDVTCKKCGTVERSHYGGRYYLCAGCLDTRVSEIRRLAAEGLNQTQIGQRLGISQAATQVWIVRYGIKTKRMEKPKAKTARMRAPDPFRVPVHPTEYALRAVSVFNLGAA